MRTAHLLLGFLALFSINLVGKDYDSISVEGVGEISVVPDIAFVEFSVETLEDSARESQQKNATICDKVNGVLKTDLKVLPKDLQTSGFRVNAEYEWTNSHKTLKGYRTSNRFTVAFRQMDQLGKVLDKIAAAGVNQISNIRFDTEKRQSYELQAIARAMKNAREKADLIAKSSNRKIRKVVHVVQGGGWSSSPIMPMGGMGRNAKMAMAAEASTSVSAGELTIRTTVNVDYAL